MQVWLLSGKINIIGKSNYLTKCGMNSSVVNALCPDAGVCVDPNMPPPSAKQVYK